MKKETAEGIKNSLPSLITNLAGYLTSLVSLESQKVTLTNASGTIGFFVSLFGKPLIDKYYEKLRKNKLAKNGFYTYVRASFVQTQRSLEKVQVLLVDDADLSIVGLGIEKNFNLIIESLEKRPSISVFQPKFHPGIALVRDLVSNTLQSLIVSEALINSFLKDFNENIEKTVADEFGAEYEIHRNEVRRLLFLENETKFLLEQVRLSKIGFVEEETLEYEETFGDWKPLSERSVIKHEYSSAQIEEVEKGLSNVKTLIDQYFALDSENHLEKLLFIVADFGKGKSVFLRQYASELARNYLETGDGYFPVYFNLRNFSSFSNDGPLGVIDDFLQTKYGIQIKSDHFKSRKYLFLVDSLDESCDLSRSAIENVINSIKRVQNIDKSLYRTNKIIVTSRYFETLLNIISCNTPYIRKIEKKEVGFYISIYGFKKSQFNNWIYNALKNILDSTSKTDQNEFVLSIIKGRNFKKGDDLHQILLDNGTLQSSELRRPIFAYMIYQLIKNNVDITQVGKIGIYLSFLNLLTKEAKYIHEPGIKSSIQEQLEARNILHQIAALWMYERQRGQQGFLKKADICRLIENFGPEEPDDVVIEKYKKGGGKEIQFLSHSYFGENDNLLHFQHQSFGEILLAEYFIKVFIKCALDRAPNLDFLIAKLKVGIPTIQTIHFFIEILRLLRDTISEIDTVDVREKRKLLFPLLASISIEKNNKSLFSDHLYFKWYEEARIGLDTKEIPESLITNWCIDRKTISKIVSLCEELINSERISILSKSQSFTSLIEREITFISNPGYAETILLEKYIALVAGNVLYNNNDKYFAGKIAQNRIDELLKNEIPSWARSMFKGLNYIGPGKVIFEGLDLMRVDFSNSTFEGVFFW